MKTCLATAVLIGLSALKSEAAPFLVDTQSAVVNSKTKYVRFSITFNQAPNFFIFDAYGRPEDDFQYSTPKSVIRGGEIYIKRNMISIRGYEPPDTSSPSSGGWGAVIATVPFSLSGATIIFSAPLDLFSDSSSFQYQLSTYSHGVRNQCVRGSSSVLAPEPGPGQ
jgi:hypothetical protein